MGPSPSDEGVEAGDETQIFLNIPLPILKFDCSSKLRLAAGNENASVSSRRVTVAFPAGICSKGSMSEIILSAALTRAWRTSDRGSMFKCAFKSPAESGTQPAVKALLENSSRVVEAIRAFKFQRSQLEG